MNAILLSIQPQHLAKILNGEKTVEIRKTMPKCDLPIEVYLYCTKGDLKLFKLANDEWIVAKENDIDRFSKHSGKIVAKFTLNKVSPVVIEHAYNIENNEKIMKAACLEPYQFWAYLGNSPDLYAWHITDLVVFNKPMDLSNFKTAEYKYGKLISPPRELTRPPQSWQYVEISDVQ